MRWKAHDYCEFNAHTSAPDWGEFLGYHGAPKGFCRVLLNRQGKKTVPVAALTSEKTIKRGKTALAVLALLLLAIAPVRANDGYIVANMGSNTVTAAVLDGTTYYEVAGVVRVSVRVMGDVHYFRVGGAAFPADGWAVDGGFGSSSYYSGRGTLVASSFKSGDTTRYMTAGGQFIMSSIEVDGVTRFYGRGGELLATKTKVGDVTYYMRP